MANSWIKNWELNWNSIFRVGGFLLIVLGAVMLISLSCKQTINMQSVKKGFASATQSTQNIPAKAIQVSVQNDSTKATQSKVTYVAESQKKQDSDIQDSEGKQIAIYFFIIMLGVSFAFPTLLQSADQNVSTMRIVVFMMVNVICMLLLKNGWSVDNLSEIKLDGYWMGIIAFVFGSKATQTFFENRKADSTKKEESKEETKTSK